MSYYLADASVDARVPIWSNILWEEKVMLKKGILLIATAILVIGSAFAAIKSTEKAPSCDIDVTSCGCNYWFNKFDKTRTY